MRVDFCLEVSVMTDEGEYNTHKVDLTNPTDTQLSESFADLLTFVNRFDKEKSN